VRAICKSYIWLSWRFTSQQKLAARYQR